MKQIAVLVSFNSGANFLKVVHFLSSSKLINKIVIVDNNSQQDFINQLKNLIFKFRTKIKLIENKSNLGFGSGINIGIRFALKNQAKRVLLINPDLAINDKNLSAIFRTDIDVSSPVLTFKRGSSKIYDLGGRFSISLGSSNHSESSTLNSLELDRRVDFVSGACMLVDREVFEKIGLFDERFFMYFEDVDFCLRAKKAGFTVGVNHNVVVRHNISEHKFSQNLFKIYHNLRSNLLFIFKWVPWYFMPIAISVWLLRCGKVLFNLALSSFSKVFLHGLNLRQN